MYFHVNCHDCYCCRKLPNTLIVTQFRVTVILYLGEDIDGELLSIWLELNSSMDMYSNCGIKFIKHSQTLTALEVFEWIIDFICHT